MITLNLIAPEKKQEFRLRQVYIMIKNLIILLLLIVIISSIILLFAKMIIQENFNKVVEYSTMTTKYANIFNKDVKEFNLYINNLEKIQEKNINWTQFIIKLLGLIPKEINLYSLDIQTEKILMTGFAENRESLKKFQDNLNNSGLFSNVEIPLNDLIKKENINFSIKAEINTNQLKKI